jgi:hypothetical protein
MSSTDESFNARMQNNCAKILQLNWSLAMLCDLIGGKMEAVGSISEGRRVFSWDEKETWPKRISDFPSEYSHIRGYHGCRPNDIQSYLTEGIYFPTKGEMLNEALYRLNVNYIKQEKVIEVLDELWERYYSYNTIFFTLSKQHLLMDCGHYMIYGSELILCIASKLYIEHLLEEIGVPTILSVDIPVIMLNESIVLQLKNEIRPHLRIKGYRDTLFSLSVNAPIQPDLIVNIEHPNPIRNPRKHFIEYYYYNNSNKSY